MPSRTPTRCFVALVLGMALACAATAAAEPISKCNAARKRCMGKYFAGVLGCHAKAEQKGVAVDPDCLAKWTAKVTGPKGCFDKTAAKVPNNCSMRGITPMRVLWHADGLILSIVGHVDPDYPTPTLTKCGAARKKCAAKLGAAFIKCEAEANKTGVLDQSCRATALEKHGSVTGCDVKALAHGSDCLGSVPTSQLGQTTTIFAEWASYYIDGETTGECSDGYVDPGEDCDAIASPGAGAEQLCAPELCIPGLCQCPCPSAVHLAFDATAPESRVDLGWAGTAHRSPIPGGDLTLDVECANTSRPCGVCNVRGPIVNAGPGELRNQRCTNDTSIRCIDHAPCLAGGGRCEYFVDAGQPMAAAGIATCTVSQYNGPINGTVNVETGALETSVLARLRVHDGETVDAPCPRCLADTTPNDDVQDGTCSGGERDGLGCDANGGVPDRPDFGAQSLDCPPSATSLLATRALDASATTNTATRSLGATSPACSGAPGSRCLCATCNSGGSAAPIQCDGNSDCPDPAGPIGPICGGPQCLGGANAGAACADPSECPGGTCATTGAPTQPSGCIDDPATVNALDCVDTGVADGVGECTMGPLEGTCTAPHAQRSCVGDAECAPGTCVMANRKCFLTGGGTANVGTGTLTATGAAGAPAPAGETWSSTLANVACQPPTGAPAIDAAIGLPGPGRRITKVHATNLY